MVKSMFLAAATGLALLSPASAAMYTKNSPVLQVDAKSYDKLIAKSDYVSIVEFYAPWCGHCQNLKPAYEKAAKNLAGLANVAAVNCDDDANKPFCGEFGVKGFPTLKIVRPSAKGKPTVEDYQGGRNAKAIVDAVVEKIPNNVKRVQDKDLDEFLSNANETAKAILFTDKGTTSGLLRAVAIDFLGSVSIAQVRSSNKNAIGTFGITSYPTLVLLPGGDKEGIVFNGEMNKGAIVEFLSQVASPKSDTTSSDSKSKLKPKEAEEDEHEGTESYVPPVIIKDENDQKTPPLLRMLEHAPELESTCLQPKSGTCLLVVLPEKPLDTAEYHQPLSEEAQLALASLGHIQAKHHDRRTKLFPFYTVPYTNNAGLVLREKLGLDEKDQLEVVAINAKKSWWRHYQGSEYTQTALEDWIDAIRMGDGKKEKLPAGLVAEEPEVEEPPVVIEIEEVPEPEPEPADGESEPKGHDEL